jgi:hypothetical protein
MTCVLSATLLVHLLWSRRLEIKQAKERAETASAAAVSSSPTFGGGSELAAAQAVGRPAWMWARVSEWRRTWSIVTFSFLLTGCATLLKVAAELWKPEWMRGACVRRVGAARWGSVTSDLLPPRVSTSSELSYSDIVLSTLFYQFSLYVSVRLARRGFTLGELGAVCQCATGLFMETVNMTRMKVG